VHGVDGRVRLESYPELDGITSAYERARRVVRRDGPWWVGAHGLFRARAARESGGMTEHMAGDFGSDWPWVMRLAVLGEFVRVPETLVTKSYLQQGRTLAWDFSVWERVALLAAGMGALRRAGLPISEQLRLQPQILVSSMIRWGREKLRG
jgi:hypothetical protein